MKLGPRMWSSWLVGLSTLGIAAIVAILALPDEATPPPDPRVAHWTRILVDPDTARQERRAAAVSLHGLGLPESRERLLALLDHEDPDVARAAVRGLAAGGDSEVNALGDILAGAERAAAVRAEAAVVLGETGSPRAREALVARLSALDDSELEGTVLEGLAEFPLEQTEAVFREVLESPAAPEQLQVDALDALSEIGPEAGPLLLEYATKGRTPELRAAAVDAVAFVDEYPAMTPTLLERLPHEPAPMVRAEIYRTLTFHSAEIDPSQTAALASRAWLERDSQARLEAARLLAHLLARDQDPTLHQAFELEWVWWLRDRGEHGSGRQPDAAVDALKVAGTPASRAALRHLAETASPLVADAAEEALLSSAPLPSVAASP